MRWQCAHSVGWKAPSTGKHPPSVEAIAELAEKTTSVKRTAAMRCFAMFMLMSTLFFAG